MAPYLRGSRYVLMGEEAKPPRIGVVTTAPNQTVVIQEWNAVDTTMIDWGDGQTTNHPANTGTTVSHAYAAIGTYTIQLKVNPLSVRRMDFRGVGLRIYSAWLKSCINTTFFQCITGPLGTINSADMAAWRPTHWSCFSLPAGFSGVINSADMSAWRPTNWYCYSLPAGFSGVINSADMSAWIPTNWRCYSLPVGFTGVINSADISAWIPTNWYCYSLPAGFSGVINSADMSAWRPTNWYCYSLPAGFTITVAAADFSGWVSTLLFYIQGNALTQAKVDAVLQGLYAAFAARTATGGTINVGGTNAAPSGVYQAMCPPTTGKEMAYELVNDSCAINPTKKWATCTFTA